MTQASGRTADPVLTAWLMGTPVRCALTEGTQRHRKRFTMSILERIPETWDDQRDTTFFRIVADVFPCAFVEGAGALLASYDELSAAPYGETPEAPTTHRLPGRTPVPARSWVAVRRTTN
jgi:hypothetical protein